MERFVRNSPQELNQLPPHPLPTAQQRLVGLHTELRNAEANLRPSGGGGDGSGPPEEAARSQLRAALARKLGRVSRLREDAQLLRCQMDETEADVRRQQADVDALRYELSGLHSTEPLHAELQRRMVDKAQQLSEQNEAYADLQDQLHDLMQTIQKEAEEVKTLESRIEAAPGDGLREELEGVVQGLQVSSCARWPPRPPL